MGLFSSPFFVVSKSTHFRTKEGANNHEEIVLISRVNLTNGRIIKATDIGNLASEIELMIRDDKAYTTMMMLNNSFIQHYICLICELSSYLYHDHLAEEPEIWEHVAIIPNMEVAVVQACRSVEGIFGEKLKWEDTITNRMLHWSYTPEQKEEAKKAIAAEVLKATILTYSYPKVSVEKTSAYRQKQ
mgnify:CR=1 FL=1